MVLPGEVVAQESPILPGSDHNKLGVSQLGFLWSASVLFGVNRQVSVFLQSHNCTCTA